MSSMPEFPFNEMSAITSSGLIFITSAVAVAASAASPHTSMSGSALIMARSPIRIKGWSSTT
jgi:hypothetical protein